MCTKLLPRPAKKILTSHGHRIAIMAALLGACPQPGSAAPNFSEWAQATIVPLHNWFEPDCRWWNPFNWCPPSIGLHRGTSWWNSANIIESTIDYTSLTGDQTFWPDVEAAFNAVDDADTVARNPSVTDDEGWWALTWIRAFDVKHDQRFLDRAKFIFRDMTDFWDNKCNGGIWWDKAKTHKNAIENELFLTIAARLHLRTAGDRGAGSFIDWANKEMDGCLAPDGMISNSLVNDGLDMNTCKNNGQFTWTYNQGVILGGLIDMAASAGAGMTTKDSTFYIGLAERIADKVVSDMSSNHNGILTEANGRSCAGNDCPQFKGIFMRNLALLNQVRPKDSYREFLVSNAETLWFKARSSCSDDVSIPYLGVDWSGPYDGQTAPESQSAALDAILAAVPFGGRNRAKVATTQSVQCAPSEGVANAIDGNFGTKWCGSGGGPHTLLVDLGTTMKIAGITIRHAGSGPNEPDRSHHNWNTRDFSIQFSPDGASWTTVGVTGNTCDVTYHSFPPQTARWLQLSIQRPTDGDAPAARVYEFEAFETIVSSLSCSGAMVLCAGVCADLTSNQGNCGTCGHACQPGYVCTTGQCTNSCPGGRTPCRGSCVDVHSDPSNCGSCGHACAPGQGCTSALCTTCEACVCADGFRSSACGNTAACQHVCRAHGG